MAQGFRVLGGFRVSAHIPPSPKKKMKKILG